MRTVAAREAKNEFGRLLDTAQREPVTIERHGRPVAVVLSIEDYERFEALDDAYWAGRAEEGLRSGSLGPEESERWLNSVLDAPD